MWVHSFSWDRFIYIILHPHNLSNTLLYCKWADALVLPTPEKMFDKARQVGHAAVSKASIEGDCGGLRRRSGACSSLAALGNGLKLQRSSAAKARSCSDARQGKLSQGRPRPMSHSLQRRATASVEAFKAPKRAMQQFRKPM